jgi:pyridinium-3,5-biscarboxylic acid mononucleotide synthase
MNDSYTRDPLHDLRAALTHEQSLDQPLPFARVDPRRERRKGVPEVVLADVKTPDQVVAIARRLLHDSGRAIISRVPDATRAALEETFGESMLWERYEAARLVVLRRPDHERPSTGGRVGILTAGTGDVPRTEEAAALCREMGCDVHAFYDVGVAGLHRLVDPLRRLIDARVDVIIVAAGMDGALPSVVAGLMDVPVIGLPTSIGYGMGGRGEAALLSMLQTCAPGLAVVNIDNGIGAGAMAGIIANNAARARSEAHESG